MPEETGDAPKESASSDQELTDTDKEDFLALLERLGNDYDIRQDWLRKRLSPTYTKDSRKEFECYWQCKGCLRTMMNWMKLIKSPPICICGSIKWTLISYHKVDY